MLQMLSSSHGLVGFRVIGGRLTSPIKELAEELTSRISPAKLGPMLVKYLQNLSAISSGSVIVLPSDSAINRLQYPTDPVQTRANSPVRITLPIKKQKSANVVRRQLGDLGRKINQQLQPVFTSKKIADHLKVTEEKPPLINQQSVVYEFTCDLCDTNYIGYTCRHLLQLVEEHKHSVIRKHFRDVHDFHANLFFLPINMPFRYF